MKMRLVAGLGGLGVLGSAITMLISGTPTRDIHLDFDAGLAQSVEAAQQCLRSADGLESWLNQAAEDRGLPSIEVIDHGDHYEVVAGEHSETWSVLRRDREVVTFSVTAGAVQTTRRLRLEAAGEGSTLYWTETGRLPTFTTLLLLGQDVGLDSFLTTAQSLGTARCA